MGRKAYNLESALQNTEEVEELSIVSRNLTHFPKEIFQLKNLKSLDLSRNQLTHIPKEINILTNLTRLSLSDNLLTDNSFCDLKLPKLRAIYLDKNQLTVIPKVIFQLKNLDYLDLENNQIHKIAPEISSLSNLLWLRLGNNLLKTLPNEIGNLIILKRLNLSNNQLKKLPESISNLTNLNRLKIAKNRINFLPKTFNQLLSLTELHLEFSSSFDKSSIENQLQNIKKLSISGNKNTLFPKEIFQLTKLSELRIRNFDCRNLDDSIGNLIHLRYVLFDNAKLEDLPANFEKLNKIEWLYFHKTPLKKLPEVILKLENLRQFKSNSKKITAQVLDFIAKSKTYTLPYFLRVAAYQIGTNDLSSLPNLSKKDLFYLLNFRFRNTEANVLNHIVNHYNLGLKNYPLNSETYLTILGKTNLNLKKVRQQIKNTTQKITAHTTHIVLGKLPGEIENLASQNFVFVRENELNRWLQTQEKPYLFNDSEAEIENLSKLLRTFQPQNIDIALQILESGGVPESILTDLVIVFKKLAPCKQKRAIRKLLAINLSEKALKVVTLKTGLLKKDNLIIKIRNLAQGTELDGEKIAAALDNF